MTDKKQEKVPEGINKKDWKRIRTTPLRSDDSVQVKRSPKESGK